MTADGPDDDPRAPDLAGAQVIPLHAGDAAPAPARPARSRRRAEPRRATRRPGPAPVTPDAANVAPAVPDAPPKRARAVTPPAGAARTSDAAAVTPPTSGARPKRARAGAARTPDATAVTPARSSAGPKRVGAGTEAGPAPADGPRSSTGEGPSTGAGPTTLPHSGELPPGWEAALADALAFLRRRLTGDYAVDEFGFDADLTDNVVLPLLRPLYRTWFRVETTGLHHVPDEGGALVVANHSGTVPLDALMTSVALHDDHPAHRYLRMLGADLVFRMPVVGQLSRKHGSTLACTADAERLLTAGELVGVWPEGFKGIGKPFADRYKLQRFGRGGFVSAALRTGKPIIPCSIVGAEETYPKIADVPALARLLNLPYFPVTPTFPLLGPLGAVPLPSKWLIEFGEPLSTAELGPDAADDPMLVFNLADQVRETIQLTLYRLLGRRRNAFQG
jgi:1-acyl-sn-glycerol-3-phosphate acyltransferase